MPSSRLPATGKSYQITWTVGGSPIAVADKVERFSVKCDKTKIRSKYIGSSGSQTDEEFDGWSGSFTAVIDSSQYNEIEDQIINASIAGTKLNIGLNVRASFSDGSVESYEYPDITMEVEVSGARGESVKAAYTWETGSNRIRIN